MEAPPTSRKRQRSSGGRPSQQPARPAAGEQAPDPTLAPPVKKRKRETRETREKLEAFKDEHHLWKPRTRGKSDQQRYATTVVLDNPEVPRWDYERRDTVGYLVVVPVPLRAVYERGSDRHPAQLVKKYVKAIATASGVPRSDRDATAAAQQRLRLLFCINKQDGFTKTTLTSEAVEDELRNQCKELNQWFTAADLPAVMLPVLWAVARPGAQEVYLSQDDVAKDERGHIDKLRRALAKLGLVDKPESLRPAYPFATVRSLALLTEHAAEMIQQLARRNRLGVYVLTGDADLVSLHPVTKATSIFHSYDQKLGPGPELARAGGAYRFFA